MKPLNLHPKVKAVAWTGAALTVINGALHQWFGFNPTPAEVTLETAALLSLAGYLKRAVAEHF